MKYLIFFISLIISCIGIEAKDYSPSDLQNPNIADRRIYVADPADLVSPEAERRANATLWKLRQATGAEVVAVVVPNTGNLTKEEFAVKLFDNWKVGKSDKDNGAIILIVPDQREAFIATGYGLEGIIPDISASQILRRSVVPYMKNNDLDGALTSVTADVANVLSDPVAAEELKSSKKEAWEEQPESDITGEDIFSIAMLVVGVAAILSFVIYFRDIRANRRKDRYHQARAWQKDMDVYLLMAVLSLGIGLLPYWLAKRRYRKLRNDPMQCPACRGKMSKLNEEEDNNLLSPSQDMEEQLDSVDYDVWVCDDCGTVERFAFPNSKSKYEECPHCHTRAMYLAHDHTLIAPTVHRSGTGERIYECKYCGNQTRRRYTIPKREDAAAAALAAGAIMGSRGGSSGGGFGGGFGGGRTGGGGGGARW